MLFRREFLTLAGRTSLCAAFIVMSAGISQAQITGELWQNQSSVAGNALLSSVAGLGTPDALFNSGAINYQSQVTAYTLGAYLNNPTFYNESANFSTPVSGYGPNANLNNTVFYFTGNLYLNAGANSFVVAHDDGLQLNIGGGIGLVVNQPGATGEVFTPFNVTAPSAGTYSFQLVYGECCGAPADLVWTINNQQIGTVPDGAATMSLLGIGLGALGVFGRRIKK